MNIRNNIIFIILFASIQAVYAADIETTNADNSCNLNAEGLVELNKNIISLQIQNLELIKEIKSLKKNLGQ